MRASHGKLVAAIDTEHLGRQIGQRVEGLIPARAIDELRGLFDLVGVLAPREFHEPALHRPVAAYNEYLALTRHVFGPRVVTGRTRLDVMPDHRTGAAHAGHAAVEGGGELVRFIDDNEALAEGQPRNRPPPVILGITLVDDLGAAGRYRRRPAGKALQRPLDR